MYSLQVFINTMFGSLCSVLGTCLVVGGCLVVFEGCLRPFLFIGLGVLVVVPVAGAHLGVFKYGARPLYFMLIISIILKY